MRARARGRRAPHHLPRRDRRRATRTASTSRRGARSRSCSPGAGPEFVALRASMIVGAGSASFGTLVRIVSRLPVLALPAWRDAPHAAHRRSTTSSPACSPPDDVEPGCLRDRRPRRAHLRRDDRGDRRPAGPRRTASFPLPFSNAEARSRGRRARDRRGPRAARTAHGRPARRPDRASTTVRRTSSASSRPRSPRPPSARSTRCPTSDPPRVTRRPPPRDRAERSRRLPSRPPSDDG